MIANEAEPSLSGSASLLGSKSGFALYAQLIIEAAQEIKRRPRSIQARRDVNWILGNNATVTFVMACHSVSMDPDIVSSAILKGNFVPTRHIAADRHKVRGRVRKEKQKGYRWGHE
jgi:hypothetical protein